MRKMAIAVAVSLCSALVSVQVARAVTCGDGVTEAPEECDNGGYCIGSSNAGTACTSSAACPGGECKTAGGDGCAANCTTERDVNIQLVPGVSEGLSIRPGTSGVVADAGFLQLPLPLSGKLVMTIGKQRDGKIPVVVKASGIDFPAVPVLSLACGCVHGATAKTCGGTFFEADGTTLSTDCTANEALCAGKKPCTFVHGPGNTASGNIGCTGIDGNNLTYTLDAGGDSGTALPPVVTINGSGPAGSASILTTIGVNVAVGGCTGTGAAYGPDGKFCTADDASDFGAAATLPAVTGMATATITNLPDGGEIGPTTVTGAPFTCSQVELGNPGGSALVSAFALAGINVMGISSLGVTVNLVAKDNPVIPPSCAGDCDGSNEVTVNEIIAMVNIALGSAPASTCAAGDVDGNGEITVNEIVSAVNKALGSCS